MPLPPRLKALPRPVQGPHTSLFIFAAADDAVQAVFVGHACCLVQLDGVTFLTDPALSERVSGVQVPPSAVTLRSEP